LEALGAPCRPPPAAPDVAVASGIAAARLHAAYKQSEAYQFYLCGRPPSGADGRQGFRRNFQFDSTWRGRRYAMKQIEVLGVWERDDWLVITVIVKYF
jgi:hypothetical protein